MGCVWVAYPCVCGVRGRCARVEGRECGRGVREVRGVCLRSVRCVDHHLSSEPAGIARLRVRCMFVGVDGYATHGPAGS